MKLPPVAEVVRLRTSRDKPPKSHDLGYERNPGCGPEDFRCGRSPDRATSFRPRVSPQTERPSINPLRRRHINGAAAGLPRNCVGQDFCSEEQHCFNGAFGQFRRTIA